MCGRYNITSTAGLQVLLGGLHADLKLTNPAYNVAPTEPVILLRHDGGTVCSAELARWWLTPSWAKERSQKYAMFNARSEGLSKSPAFRKPFASQRGIVPMSSFIEWRGSAGDKQPWLISNEAEALAVAALWDLWFDGAASDSKPLLSCTLVTTAAAGSFRPWHSRMPVMLASGDRERWLDNQAPIATDDPIFRPHLHEALYLVPISRAAGNSRNKSPDSMLPMGERVMLPPAQT